MTPDELLEKAAKEAASYACQCDNNGDPERFEKGCSACEACDAIRSLIGKYVGEISLKENGSTDLKTE